MIMGGGGGVWMDFGDFATLLFCLMVLEIKE